LCPLAGRGTGFQNRNRIGGGRSIPATGPQDEK